MSAHAWFFLAPFVLFALVFAWIAVLGVKLVAKDFRRARLLHLPVSYWLPGLFIPVFFAALAVFAVAVARQVWFTP